MTQAAEPGDPRDPAAMAYDEAFAELERVVARLETGVESLEATITLYERAVALQRRCERLLDDAVLRVQQLMPRADGSAAPVDVRPEDASAE